MSPKRPRQRRVNRHVKALHCECGKSYTRADFYECHLQASGHCSEYIAASDSLPNPTSDPRHFYCSCGAGYTAAHSFHAHCKRTGHIGNWSRSKYQPKNHHLTLLTADVNAQGVSSGSTAAVEYIISPGLAHQPTKRETFTHLSNSARPLDSDNSGIGSSIDEEQTNMLHEANLQATLLANPLEGESGPSDSSVLNYQKVDDLAMDQILGEYVDSQEQQGGLQNHSFSSLEASPSVPHGESDQTHEEDLESDWNDSKSTHWIDFEEVRQEDNGDVEEREVGANDERIPLKRLTAAPSLELSATPTFGNINPMDSQSEKAISNERSGYGHSTDDGNAMRQLLGEYAEADALIIHDRTGLLPHEIDNLDLTVKYARTRDAFKERMSRKKAQAAKSGREEVSDPYKTRYWVAETTIMRQASLGRTPGWKRFQARTVLCQLRKTINARVKKACRTARKTADFVGTHKGKVIGTVLFLTVMAGARYLKDQASLPPVASSCQQRWLLDPRAPRHIARDSSIFSNVDALYKVCPLTRSAEACNWTGTVPLRFNGGSTLLLQDVLYDAKADTNVMSLLKLYKAGLVGNFSAAEVTIRNITDDELIGRAPKYNNVYCLEDLASPPRSTEYPSRNTSVLTVEASDSNDELSDNWTQDIPRSGLIGSLLSVWACHTGFPQVFTSPPVTTTYPPYESASNASPVTWIDPREPTAQVTIPSTTLQPTLFAPSTEELPSVVVPVRTSFKRSLSALSLATTKRKREDNLKDPDKTRTKRPRTISGIWGFSWNQLRELRETPVNATNRSKPWPIPEWLKIPSLPGSFTWAPYEIPNSTSTPSTTSISSSLTRAFFNNTMSALRTATAQDVPTALSEPIESNSVGVGAASQWTMPLTFLGLGTRVDARQYGLDEHAEAEKKATGSRQELEKMIEAFEDRACPPFEPCKKWWLF